MTTPQRDAIITTKRSHLRTTCPGFEEALAYLTAVDTREAATDDVAYSLAHDQVRVAMSGLRRACREGADVGVALVCDLLAGRYHEGGLASVYGVQS